MNLMLIQITIYKKLLPVMSKLKQLRQVSLKDS